MAAAGVGKRGRGQAFRDVEGLVAVLVFVFLTCSSPLRVGHLFLSPDTSPLYRPVLQVSEVLDSVARHASHVWCHGHPRALSLSLGAVLSVGPGGTLQNLGSLTHP